MRPRLSVCRPKRGGDSYRPARAGSGWTTVEREWETWLRGDQPTLGMTFEREAANADRSLAFITPVHPLTQAAARSIAGDEELRVALAVSVPDMASGDHPFAMYQWQFSGLKEDAMLVPVVADEDVARILVDALANARDLPGLLGPLPSANDALDGWHHELWTRRRAEHVARFRRDSLQASFRARMAVLEEHRDRVSEERIRRMRTAQIDRAVADQAEALARLARDEARADIFSRRVAAGIIRVEG